MARVAQRNSGSHHTGYIWESRTNQHRNHRLSPFQHPRSVIVRLCQLGTTALNRSCWKKRSSLFCDMPFGTREKSMTYGWPYLSLVGDAGSLRERLPELEGSHVPKGTPRTHWDISNSRPGLFDLVQRGWYWGTISRLALILSFCNEKATIVPVRRNSSWYAF